MNPPPESPWFADRSEAGERLAEALVGEGAGADLVLAVPNGGVAVAAPVARALGARVDVLVARKVGAPMQPELALGAVTRFGVVWNQSLLDDLHLSETALAQAQMRAQRELERRERTFRAVRAAEPVRGRRVLLVDDGLATGATMAAAVEAVQSAGAASVGVAVPVATNDAVNRLRALGATVMALSVPPDFRAVGAFYDDFRPISDASCAALLREVSTDTDELADGPTRPPR